MKSFSALIEGEGKNFQNCFVKFLNRVVQVGALKCSTYHFHNCDGTLSMDADARNAEGVKLIRRRCVHAPFSQCTLTVRTECADMGYF